jgi:hypothetical protein
MQIKMFIEHPELKPKPSFNMLEGETHHREVASKLKDVIGEEMGNCLNIYDGNGITIWFSNDVCCEKGIIEIKSVDKNRQTDWYFTQSVTQCAVYSVLSMYCNYDLKTAKFYTNQGNPYVSYKYEREEVPYYLYFGDEIYRIDILDIDKILQFITEKAIACMEWETAREFDKQYKHMEYNILSDAFKVVRIR